MPDRYTIEPLGRHHDRAAFSCGVEALDRYLHHQAGHDVRRRVAAVFVLIEVPHPLVLGYYTLSATAVQATGLPDDLVRRLPRYPQLLALLIGRLAVDLRGRGQGLGQLLLANGLQRSSLIADQVGAMFVIVDAKDDAARGFYERHGFRRFLDDEYRLFLPMTVIERARSQA
jgi:ribosomal protein S18 acetylase RimI-like enzyme